MESTVRPIDEENWVEVNPKKSSNNDDVSNGNSLNNNDDGFESNLLPLQVNLPPSLLPIHSSVFNIAPPCDWG